MSVAQQAPHLQRGLAGEELAGEYLQQHGLQLVTRNYRCKLGEIDLIMQERDHTLVFVEVRYRQNNSHGGSAASVTINKQQKLIRTALYYLQNTKLLNKVACRFDVLAISGPNQVEWIKDAFRPEY